MPKDPLKELPADTKDFQIDIIGKVTGKRFLGDFTCKIPSVKDQCLSAKFEAALNGEYPGSLPKGILNAHKKVAYLRFALVEFPKFWRDSEQGYDLKDINVIDAVYSQCESFEEEWMNLVWGEEPQDGDEEEKEPKKE